MCRPINQDGTIITALTERAADRRASTISETSPKTVSYRVASLVEGTGSFMPSNPYPCEDSVNGPAKLPLSDPIFPLFEHDRPCHGVTARTADRAVLVRLRRFLAGIHVPSEGIVRQALSTN